MALAGQLQISQRMPVQVPVGFGGVRVQRHRIGSGNQGLLQNHVRGIASAWPVPQEYAKSVDERQRRPHKISQVYQAFVNLLMQPLTRSAQDAVPVLHAQRGAGQDVSTCPRRSTSRNRWSSGRTTSAPAARAAAAMPLRAKQDRGSLMLTSVTMARRAPASRQSRLTSATTSGLVLAACSIVRSQATLGLMTTTSPREMKRRMPPSSWIARRAMRAGSSPWTTTISGRAASAGT